MAFFDRIMWWFYEKIATLQGDYQEANYWAALRRRG